MKLPLTALFFSLTCLTPGTHASDSSDDPIYKKLRAGHAFIKAHMLPLEVEQASSDTPPKGTVRSAFKEGGPDTLSLLVPIAPIWTDEDGQEWYVVDEQNPEDGFALRRISTTNWVAPAPAEGEAVPEISFGYNDVVKNTAFQHTLYIGHQYYAKSPFIKGKNTYETYTLYRKNS
ncbi:MAG: hypothetical protein ACK5TR_05000 [Alphaproteobacteria bacterium]|jgi:hypothetical protein|nr:hypothetical protein [Alphaproteobacteria bacterium]